MLIVVDKKVCWCRQEIRDARKLGKAAANAFKPCETVGNQPQAQLKVAG